VVVAAQVAALVAAVAAAVIDHLFHLLAAAAAQSQLNQLLQVQHTPLLLALVALVALVHQAPMDQIRYFRRSLALVVDTVLRAVQLVKMEILAGPVAVAVVNPLQWQALELLIKDMRAVLVNPPQVTAPVVAAAVQVVLVLMAHLHKSAVLVVMV
jgi:hypothetical protein